MRLKSISWKNYRQYQDKTIVLSKNKKWDLHYFIAENGIGKTTFFNSVCWCLYKDEPYLTDQDRSFTIMSKATKQGMQVGDIKPVRVELVVECDDGEICYIRTSEMRKTEELEMVEVDSNLTVMTLFKGQEAKSYCDDDAIVWVNQFVPSRLRNYYFFDAEGLKGYFSSASNADVRTAVYEISDIQTMTLMEERLQVMESEYRTSAAKNNPEAEKIDKKLRDKEQELEKKVREKTRKEKQLETAQGKYQECVDFLAKEPDVEEIESKRDRLAQDIKEYEEKEARIREKIKAFARRYMVLISVYPDMKLLHEKLCEMDNQDELPPKVTLEYLQEMQNAKKCLVCGREFDGASLCHVEYLISQHRSKKTLALLSSTKTSIESLLRETLQYKNKRDDLLEQLSTIKKILDRLVDEKEAIDRDYDEVTDKEKIKYYAQMRPKYEREIFSCGADVKALRSQISALKKDIETLRDDLKVALQKSKQKDKDETCMELSRKGKMVIHQIIEDIRDDIRAQISKEMKKTFLSLIWKKSTYKDVELTGDYSISAKDEFGEEGVGSTSGAEGQLLALSFILGLQSVSGFNSPLIIDTPVARTSGKLRGNFCDVLRRVSERQQVILFFTQDEFNSVVRNALKGYESNSFALELVDEKYIDVRCTNG